MGRFTNSVLANTIVWATVIAIGALSLFYVYQQVF
jgi:hypothetical protein